MRPLAFSSAFVLMLLAFLPGCSGPDPIEQQQADQDFARAQELLAGGNHQASRSMLAGLVARDRRLDRGARRPLYRRIEERQCPHANQRVAPARIPVGGVLVNMLIDKASVGAEAADFVKNRVAMQDEHMKTVWQKFDGSVRAIVPLYETEIRGVPMLKRLGDAMFA